MPSIHVIITGKVQGVGYRSWAAKRAKAWEIDGWVRNLSDGSVEAFFSSPDNNHLTTMIRACYRGPLNAEVDSIIQSEETGLNVEKGFYIQR